MSSKIPSDAAAVVYNGSFYVLYVQEDGAIGAYIGPDKGVPEDAVNEPPYGKGLLMMGDQPIIANTEEPRVAAVSYKLGDVEHIRAYFTNPKNELQEICFSSDRQGWYKGSLTSVRIKASPKSLLTVNVDQQWLKLYYQFDEGNTMRVAWVVKGETAWTHRQIATAG